MSPYRIFLGIVVTIVISLQSPRSGTSGCPWWVHVSCRRCSVNFQRPSEKQLNALVISKKSHLKSPFRLTSFIIFRIPMEILPCPSCCAPLRTICNRSQGARELPVQAIKNRIPRFHDVPINTYIGMFMKFMDVKTAMIGPFSGEILRTCPTIEPRDHRRPQETSLFLTRAECKHRPRKWEGKSEQRYAWWCQSLLVTLVYD